MSFLKQSTTITLRLGPALDKTDGVTEETALTPTVEISKAGGAFAARNSATAIAHDSNGWYSVELNATDTNTVGLLRVKFDDAATHLPVWEPFTVLPAVVYDALIAGTDNFDVNVVQWLGAAAATPTVAGVPEVDVTHWIGTAAATPTVAGVPEVDVTHWIGTAAATPTVAGVPEVDVTHIAGAAVSTTTAQLGVNTVSLTAGSIGTGTFATGAVNANALATDAVTEIAAGISNSRVVNSGILAGVSGLTVTLPGTAESTAQFYQYKTLKIISGTGINQSRNIVSTSGLVLTIDTAWAVTPTTASGYEIHDTHSPYETSTALVDLVWDELRSGHVTSGTFGEKVNAQVVGVDAAAVASIRAVASGTATSGSTTTMVDSARIVADNDWWKGMWILFTSGTVSDQCRLITASTGATGSLTFAPATTAAVSTQTYQILPAGAVDVRLWNGTAPNNLVSGRTDSSVGAMAADVVTAAAIQDAAIDAASIATGAITAAKFAAGAIDAAAIADNAIDAGALATGAITAAKFAAGAIDAAAIADNAIDAGALATGAITAAKFAAGALDAAALAADAGTEIAAAVWDRAESAITTASSIGVKIKNVLPQRPIKNTALNNFEFTMIDSADHVSGKTGLTVTAQKSIDGVALAPCVNSPTEVSNGIYKINLHPDDMNGDIITFRFSATGADDVTITVLTQPAAA